jgi:hypothetical protein
MNKASDMENHEPSCRLRRSAARVLVVLAAACPVQGLAQADPYEHDDSPAGASELWIPDVQSNHTFHTSGDEDWSKFFSVPSQPYTIRAAQEGTNVDAVLEVFRLLPDGTLSNTASADAFGEGTGIVEQIIYSPPEPEVSYIRVRSSLPGFGEGSTYTLSIRVFQGGGVFYVYAIDTLTPTGAPPESLAIVDGMITQHFDDGFGVNFQGLPSGIHTVEVQAAAGYLPDSGTNLDDRASNPLSKFYGNPRLKEADPFNNAIAFFFIPTIEAGGRVRDATTRAWLPGVQVSFHARDDRFTNAPYTKYPNFANYGSNWVTGADGGFPDDVILPAIDWDLHVSRTHYQTAMMASALSDVAVGTEVDLGTLDLPPADLDTNGLADGFEWEYFGSNGVDGDTDHDLDGHSPSNEWRLGTDPTNPASVLAFEAPERPDTNGFTLRFPAAAGRTYRIGAAETAVTDHWPVVAGPWTAPSDLVQSWTDTNAPAKGQRVYRLQVLLP